MAYREPMTPKSWDGLAMFSPPAHVIARVNEAFTKGQTVEMEHTSFNDPGPDESRVLVNGERVFTIPGY
jgi:hypothetical protein